MRTQYKNLAKSTREFEMNIIGRVGTNNDFSTAFFPLVESSEFINQDIASLYSILKESFLNGTESISVISKSGLSSLYSDCLETIHFLDVSISVSKIKENIKTKKFIELVLSVSETNIDNVEDSINKTQAEIISLQLPEQENTGMASVVDEFEKERSIFAEKRKLGKKILGYSTGYQKLDAVIDGLRNGHFWVIGGYTSSGKTFISLNLANNLIKQNIKVSFYSLEMSKIDLFGRMLGLLTGQNGQYLTKAELNENETKKLNNAKEILLNSGMTIHTNKRNLKDVLVSMLSEITRKSADVFIIDYGQLIQTEDKSEYDAMRNMAVELQAFAQKRKVPIILLSQISNESAKNPENSIIGFKGSGAIGASADIAIELISGEQDKDEKMRKFKEGEAVRVKMCIKKNRHGRIGEIDYLFHTKTGLFEEEDLLKELHQQNVKL